MTPAHAGLFVHELRERLGVHTALAPEAEHHGGRGTAAERFRLGNEWNRDDAKRLGCCRAQGQREQQAKPQNASRQAREKRTNRISLQSMATTSKMITRSTMMMVVVEITSFDCPPASACSTC